MSKSVKDLADTLKGDAKKGQGPQHEVRPGQAILLHFDHQNQTMQIRIGYPKDHPNAVIMAEFPAGSDCTAEELWKSLRVNTGHSSGAIGNVKSSK